MHRVGEDGAPQRRAIELACGQEHSVTERAANRGITRFARRGQLVRERIGIDDLDAEAREGTRRPRDLPLPIPPVRPTTMGMLSAGRANDRLICTPRQSPGR